MLTRLFLAAWLLVLLGGCAANRDEVIPPLSAQVNFPAIGLFNQLPGNRLESWCDQQQKRQHADCQAGTLELTQLQSRLADSGLFPLITLEAGADYELLLSSAQIEDHKVRAELILAWRGILLHRYEYQVDTTEASAKIVRLLIADMLQDKVFSSGYLAGALESDNYEKDLQAPAKVANFQLSHRLTYNDPFQGSILTYKDPAYSSDRIEVSVYPIPSSDLSNTPAIIEEETAKLRGNLSDFAKQHNLPPLTMSQDKMLDWTQQSKQFQGYYLDASIVSRDTEPFYASYFFFIQQDKIVRFTTTFPSDLAMNFVKEALPQMAIPGESAFMAKLRKP
ncbi:hypothetical protein GCM10009092_23650 [Bowmanella denitrificans]|uniref:DUF3298 domain-containing protein n=1 Tax=Bowmanella denitrificans TaxID=366582 RepID=A0ABN0X9J6_9ALTE